MNEKNNKDEKAGSEKQEVKKPNLTSVKGIAKELGYSKGELVDKLNIVESEIFAIRLRDNGTTCVVTNAGQKKIFTIPKK
jgi:hypothetical protein